MASNVSEIGTSASERYFSHSLLTGRKYPAVVIFFLYQPKIDKTVGKCHVYADSDKVVARIEKSTTDVCLDLAN